MYTPAGAVGGCDPDGPEGSQGVAPPPPANPGGVRSVLIVQIRSQHVHSRVSNPISEHVTTTLTGYRPVSGIPPLIRKSRPRGAGGG